jgi:hypothetical protein
MPRSCGDRTTAPAIALSFRAVFRVAICSLPSRDDDAIVSMMAQDEEIADHEICIMARVRCASERVTVKTPPARPANHLLAREPQ